MGAFSDFLSKFKGKKSIDTLKEFEAELQNIKNKTRAEIIALIGTGGRLKGLPLIYVADDDDDLKSISARIVELIKPLDLVSNGRVIRDMIINYNDEIIFFKPFLENMAFVGLIYKKDDILVLKQLIYKNEQTLKDIFQSEEE